jgi:hypothetical protein
MIKILRLLPVIGIYMILVSATCIVKRDTTAVYQQGITLRDPNHSGVLKTHKLNFFQRLMLKAFLRKDKLKNGNKADGLASTSLLLGIGACGFLLLGLFVPYIIFASVPAGIAAMITGSSAIRKKTSLTGKAATGKGLGLGALIAFGVILIVAAIMVAAFFGSI